MKINYIKIACLTFAFGVLVGCDDYLDVDARDKVTEEDSGVTNEPIDFVNGIYGMMTEWDYAFSYLGITEIISDNADKGSAPGDQGGDKGDLDALTHTSTVGSVEAMWTNWYKAIGRATYSINFTENYGLTDEAYKNRLIGEAKFLRAYHYFFLVRGWGDVPLQHIDLVNRAPKAQVYEFIKEDLLAAIATLPEKNEYAAEDLGRATKGAAKALLAKVYLYQKDWTNALKYSNEVINSGQYGLELDYAQIWRENTENGTESIFEVQGRGSSIAHGVQQYTQTQGARGPGGWGWGFNTPSQNLVDAFDSEGDLIRKNATIIFAGDIMYDGRVVDPVENPRYNEKAYSGSTSGTDDADKNIRVLRLGEIYLIKAEAANELNDQTTAREALNKVRDRVNLGFVTLTDQALLRKAIWKERRLELAFEHDRWFDLIRTGEAKEAMEANGKTFVVGRHELFPIPNVQLIQTPGMVPNPGY